MNKKLIAVAVAGMFVAPAAALAQSSVTISGLLKGGFESLKLSNSARTGNTSQQGVVDDSSRIVFNVVEDLGGGLQAIGQLDMRVKPDDAGGAQSPASFLAGGGNTGNVINGNSHFGLRSKDWGRIFFGRQDLHYFNNESNISDKGSLRANSVSLLAYVNNAAGSNSAIAGGTRTQNVIHYTTPNWGGFTMIAAYSSNPGGQDGDISALNSSASNARKGYAWNLNPNFAAANWQVGYSYWQSKPDYNGGILANGGIGAAAVAALGLTAPTPINERSDRLYGSYVFPFGLKIGGAWDKSSRTTDGGSKVASRTAWSLPASYNWGNHTVHLNYSTAGDNKSKVAGSADQGSAMWAASYSYDLSKRTSAAFTYAQISNKAGASYNFFTSTSLGLGGSAGAIAGGEDPKMWGVTLRHAF